MSGNSGITRAIGASALLTTLVGVAPSGCDRLPGKPPPYPPPVVSASTPAGFQATWTDRCSGCHGADGSLGAGLPMRNGEYLMAVPEDTMFSIIRDGIPSSRMPGFGGDAIGGLDDEVIRAFVQGMRSEWGDAGVKGVSRGIPWKVDAADGDPARGGRLFAANCASCHPSDEPADRAVDPGPDPLVAGSVTDPFYLRLVSDQHLHSNIVFGRADLGMPGAAGPFRGPNGKTVEGALDAGDVADLVAYLGAGRSSLPSGPEVKDGAP